MQRLCCRYTGKARNEGVTSDSREARFFSDSSSERACARRNTWPYRPVGDVPSLALGDCCREQPVPPAILSGGPETAFEEV